MIDCPQCGHANIEGVDLCEQCRQPLDDVYLTDPPSAMERGLISDGISSLNPNKPIVVSPDMPVSRVLSTLVERQIGCVFVVDASGKIIGVFSERDALMRLNSQVQDHADKPISDFMTREPQTLQTDARVAFAIHQMDLGGYRHLPIIDQDGAPVGVISVRDILKYLTSKATEVA